MVRNMMKITAIVGIGALAGANALTANRDNQNIALMPSMPSSSFVQQQVHAQLTNLMLQEVDQSTLGLGNEISVMVKSVCKETILAMMGTVKNSIAQECERLTTYLGKSNEEESDINFAEQSSAVTIGSNATSTSMTLQEHKFVDAIKNMLSGDGLGGIIKKIVQSVLDKGKTMVMKLIQTVLPKVKGQIRTVMDKACNFTGNDSDELFEA